MLPLYHITNIKVIVILYILFFFSPKSLKFGVPFTLTVHLGPDYAHVMAQGPVWLVAAGTDSAVLGRTLRGPYSGPCAV